MPKLKNKRAIIETEIGVKFFYRGDTNDEQIINQVFEKQSYLGDKIQVGPDYVVVDIGAHIGTFSLLAATKGADVYAIEPEPSNFRLLKKNIKENKLGKRIKAYKKAVVGKVNDDKEKVTLHHFKDNTGGSSLWKKNETGEKAVDGFKAEVVPIKKVIHKNVDLLKLDCEGAEYQILRNAPLEKIKRISMEWHNLEKLPELITLLIKNDFKLIELLGDTKRGILKAVQR